MNNKEAPYREQAERLKQPIEKINKQLDGPFESESSLPPREQLHGKKKKKLKWKVKYPVIRLLVLLFILLPIIIFSVISYLDGKKTGGAVKQTVNSVGETINLETPKQNDKKKAQSQEQNQVEINNENNGSQVPAVNIDETNSETSFKSMPNTEKDSPATNTSQGDSVEGSADHTGDSAKQTVKSEKASMVKPRIIYHTVHRKETLYLIAKRYYHSSSGMEMIRKANHLNSDQLYVGQVLKIPLND
ncbi:LysM peptidoglycan-binding domain-containing protein [Neobacillus fumarioli]|uniref:LysM peptidoglycan-binding domain-containing protein n=1 Tax=Neobacillus fumarioli TaxID=105229 RepID=UPI000829DE28|nr:LysM peptidoglycan-binding domain-containing protein [Neobacillus fumarioli]